MRRGGGAECDAECDGAIPRCGVRAGLRVRVVQYGALQGALANLLLVSLTIFELPFYNWQQLPFAYTYAPGKKPLTSAVGRYLAALFLLAPAFSIIIATVSQLTATFLSGLTLFLAAWLRARYLRRKGWGEARLMWEDVPEALADLGLKD